jgi:hypothetical protein
MGISTKAVIGGSLVVASGSIVITQQRELVLTPVPVGPSPLRFHFVFDTLPGSPATYNIIPTGQNIYRITLFNFDGGIDIGVTSPLSVGTIASRALSLSFVAHSIGEGSGIIRVLTYTFTLDGEQDV